jgi:hypothetical protein
VAGRAGAAVADVGARSSRRGPEAGDANRNKPEELRAERITIGSKTVELR